MTVLPCSVCGCMPSVEVDQMARSMTDRTIVPNYYYVCLPCEAKYMNVEGAAFRTFPWCNENDAIDEWNSLVESENSLYIPECRNKYQLKLL